MRTHNIDQAIAKLKRLPPERIAEVEDFIDFLGQRNEARQLAAANPRPSKFPVISVGQWPQDLSLRREDMYGDDAGLRHSGAPDPQCQGF